MQLVLRFKVLMFFMMLNGLGLYAVAKLRWVVGGFAIADIARVIGCPFIRINNLKTIICY